MDGLTDFFAFLTLITGLFGLALALLRAESSQHTLFYVGLLLGVTSLFGIANVLNLDFDFILYPLRFATMLAIVISLLNPQLYEKP